MAQKKGPAISDEAVKAKTGKTWPQWFSILDRAGGKEMTHQEMVAYLGKKHKVDPWWQQMVTNTYEQHIGRRKKYSTGAGDYQVSVSRTFTVPLEKLYKSWEDSRTRKKWMPGEGFTVRKATPNKSMRITWRDKTNVEANFYSKGPKRSQVTVQHTKLTNATEVARMRFYWAKVLAALQAWLEPRERLAAK